MTRLPREKELGLTGSVNECGGRLPRGKRVASHPLFAQPNVSKLSIQHKGAFREGYQYLIYQWLTHEK
ncbi:hypothetical protein HLI_11360 [Halobacillus litoralis]|uniref:Uncharacterized protein n=1 Tax=Halobacillus litoralis TaxID=45668 RepID=A0A410MDE4_9BACI|nr:hypothetical protein HLI_11360 [Halobacillus litoralis]